MTTSPPTTLPEGVRVGDERLIRLTEAAGHKVRALGAREQAGAYLRVRVTGGGCNGLAYKLGFEQAPRAGDILVASQGAALLIDSKSALFLRGMTMDYSDRLIAGGFKFSNPNARASCSCGESFAV
jgi:iron-sulfur cluster assembly protein